MDNKIELTKEALKEILEEKSMSFTLAEIEKLMDSEVEKSEDEMDTELIDICAAILAKAYNPEYKDEQPTEMFRPWENENKHTVAAEPKKKPVVRLKYVLLVAAALVILFAVALPAGAKLFDNKASDSIIEFYNDFFKINLNKNEPTVASENDAVSDMIINSLDTFMLPDVLLGEEYEKSAYLTQEDYVTTFYVLVTNESKDISGTIMITQHKSADHNMTNGQVNIPDKHREFKQLLIEDREIIVFGMGEKSYINYTDGATNYEISLGCDFNTMVSIAETIKVKG